MNAIAAAWPELLGGVLVLAILVASAQAARRWGIAGEITRAAVHVGTGGFVVALPVFFSHPAPVTALAVSFVLVNGAARATGRLGALHEARPRSLGTVTFPLALAVTAPFFWTPARQGLLQTAFLVLAVADPLGTAIGRRAPLRRRLGAGVSGGADRPSARSEPPPPAGSSAKSWDGLAAVAVGAGLAGALGLQWFGNAAELGAGSSPLAAGIVLALLMPAVELLGDRGWDNFFLVVAAVSALLLLEAGSTSLSALLLAGAAAAGFGVGAYRAGWLDSRGAVAGALFAASLLAIGGVAWTVPALVFFVGSSLLSRGRSGRRTAGQVYANGGWAWAMLVGHLWMPDPAWLAGFLGALSSATADTWSAEIGPRFQERPRHVWTGERVPKGTSGAVSWIGSGAGLAGALAVGVGYLAGAPTSGPFGEAGTTLAVCGLAGFLGSGVDTILGASVQALYRHRIGGIEVEERPRASAAGDRGSADGDRVDGGAGSLEPRGDPLLVTPDPWELARGSSRMENDRVNAAATAAGAILAAAALHLG